MRLWSWTFLALRRTIVIGLLWSLSASADAQERRVKTRISNAAFTITALPLLAARDWKTFSANGLDAELILPLIVLL